MGNLSGIPKNSNIHRFITAGNPGGCFLCERWFKKVEAHHLKYLPEITCNLCHLCHHTVHFWPNRLTDNQKLKLLRLLFDEPIAWQKLSELRTDVRALARIIAPSRNRFVRAQQAAEIKRIKKPKTKPLKTKIPKKKHVNRS